MLTPSVSSAGTTTTKITSTSVVGLNRGLPWGWARQEVRGASPGMGCQHQGMQQEAQAKGMCVKPQLKTNIYI